MKKSVSIMIAVMLAVVFAVPVLARNSNDMRDATGMSIAGFNTQDLYGSTVTSDILQNATVTVINEWATWCGPCVSEMPHLQTIHEEFSATPENDVQIIGAVYTSGSCTPASAKQFLESNGYTWTNVLEDSVLANAFNTSDSIPSTMIVDREGRIHAHRIGSFSSANQLRDWINHWLEQLSGEEPTPPPETEPPVTEPPVTEPPVTEPPVTEPPVTEPPVTEPPAVPGDFDGDGQVTSSDAVNILRVAMGLGEVENIEAIDLDGDGAVATADAILALRLAMGL